MTLFNHFVWPNEKTISTFLNVQSRMGPDGRTDESWIVVPTSFRSPVQILTRLEVTESY